MRCRFAGGSTWQCIPFLNYTSSTDTTYLTDVHQATSAFDTKKNYRFCLRTVCPDAASCKWTFISSIYILHMVVEKHNEHVVAILYAIWCNTGTWKQINMLFMSTMYILKHRLHMQILHAPPTPTQKHIQIWISVKLKKYTPQTHVRTKSAHASEFYTSKPSSAKSISFQLVVWRFSPRVSLRKAHLVAGGT